MNKLNIAILFVIGVTLITLGASSCHKKLEEIRRKHKTSTKQAQERRKERNIHKIERCITRDGIVITDYWDIFEKCIFNIKGKEVTIGLE